MAVYAAHLTRTLQGTPSIFQITAQEALGSTVKPALKKLIEYLAAVYPRKCGWCERWYDELYLIFDCCLQYHYLKHYAGSFSECFYGLLRVPLEQTSEFSAGPRLPDLLEKGSLAMLVLAPYLRDKLEKLVEKWREQDDEGRLGKNAADQARKAAIRVYSVAHFITESSRLMALARYLIGKSRSPTLELNLLGLALKDAPPPLPEEDTWSDFIKSIFNRQFSEAVITFPMVWRAMAHTVEYGAFAVQFLRWWDARAPLASSALPVPAPPEKDARALRFANKCPLCLQTWKVPTVLPVSGYVFCYVCVSRHVRARGCCPVTSLPAGERSLVRLYVQQ